MFYGLDTVYHHDQDKDCSQITKLFEKLLRPLDKCYHLCDDRFYTSIPLDNYSEGGGFYYTGTVEARRTFLSSKPKNSNIATHGHEMVHA